MHSPRPKFIISFKDLDEKNIPASTPNMNEGIITGSKAGGNGNFEGGQALWAKLGAKLGATGNAGGNGNFEGGQALWAKLGAKLGATLGATVTLRSGKQFVILFL